MNNKYTVDNTKLGGVRFFSVGAIDISFGFVHNNSMLHQLKCLSFTSCKDYNISYYSTK